MKNQHGLFSLIMSLCMLTFSVALRAAGASDAGLPFVTTTIEGGKFAPSTKWYTMTIRGNKLISTSATQLQCQTSSEITREHLWCFVEDEKGEYSIYNLSTGVDYVAYCSSPSNSTEILMQRKGDVTNGVTLFSLTANGSNGYTLFYPGVNAACWNDYAKTGKIAIWNNSASPTDAGSMIIFSEYDASDLISPSDTGSVSVSKLQPVEGEILYVKFKDNSIDAFPLSYVSSKTEDAKSLRIVDTEGGTYVYDLESVESISNSCTMSFPQMESFSFDAKSNDMIMVDAKGVIGERDTVRIEVGGIGKRLYPSITLDDVSGVVYLDGAKYEKGKSSCRFADCVECILSFPDCRMLRMKTDGSFLMYPFGREYTIDAKFLSDNPTNEWGVPVVKINTNDGTMISSKDFYWDATIEIDGAGFFPSMEKTEMQIKGRGNTSWNSNMSADPKNPYRMKFPSKQKVLGMKSAKNWVLIANNQRGSMLCNVLGSRAAEIMKCAAANHFIPVELYINGSYRGSYNLTEKIGLAKNSVNVKDEANATLIELDTYFDEVYKFRSSEYNLPDNIKEPDLDDIESTNLTFEEIQDNFNSFTSALKGQQDIEDYVDLPSLARFLVLNEFICNYELFHPKSVYCYKENVKDDGSKFIFGPVWDFDWAFGYETTRDYFTASYSNDYWTKVNFSGKKFIYDLRYSGEKFNKQYYRVWHDFATNHVDELIEYMNDYYEVVKKSFQHDHEIRKSGGQSLYDLIVQRASGWMKGRSEYVYNHLSNKLGYADMDYLSEDEDGEEDDTTLVEHVFKNGKSIMQGVFDVCGRRISSNLNNLPKGFYIYNGKKVVKK